MANLLNASIVFRPDLIGETRSLTKRLNNWWIIRFLFIFIDLLHSWLCSLIRRSSLADEYKCQSVWGNWQFSRPFVDDDRRLPPTFLWPTRGFYAYRSIRNFFSKKKKNKLVFSPDSTGSDFCAWPYTISQYTIGATWQIRIDQNDNKRRFSPIPHTSIMRCLPNLPITTLPC